MSSAERQRRFLDRIRGTGTAQPHQSELAELKAENAKLKATLKRLLEGAEERGGSQGQLKVRAASRQEFGEVGKLRGENAKLKSDVFKLKAMLQEEPDVAKLRKKVVDQQTEMALLRRINKEIAKERDALQRRVTPEYRKAKRFLTAPNYRVIIKALHSDRRHQVSSAELAEADSRRAEAAVNRREELMGNSRKIGHLSVS
jgi:hypothetical protein